MICRGLVLAAWLLAAAPAWGSMVLSQARWPKNPWDAQTPAAPAHAPRCRDQTPVLTADSVGPLRPTMSLSEVQRVCPGLLYAWRFLEGDPEPIVITQLGRLVLVIEFGDTLAATPVYRLTTDSHAARTQDQLGPGLDVALSVRAWGRPQFGQGECALYMWFPSRPGMSFALDLPSSWTCEQSLHLEQTGDWTRLPPHTKVSEVLIFGPH